MRIAAILALTLVPALAACPRSGEGVTASQSGLVFAASVGDSCIPPSVGHHSLPLGVEWFVVRMLPEPVAADTTKNALAQVVTPDDLDKGGWEVLVRGIQPGTYSYDVTGCHTDAKSGTVGATWWGRTPHVEVTNGGKAAPVVFMMPQGGLACIGGENQNALAPAYGGENFVVTGRGAFGSGVVTSAGRVIVSGGAAQADPKGEVFTAGNAVWEFDRASGVFKGVYGGKGQLSLGGGRMMHGMAEVDPTHVAVFGGAPVVSLDVGWPNDNPQAWPTGSVNAVELLSLSDGTSEIKAGEPVTMPAVAASGGWIVLAGGLDATTAKPTDKVRFVRATSLAGTAEVVEGTLRAPRFGGAAVFLETYEKGADVLLVGGWDGAKAALPPELVTLTGGNVVTSAVGGASVPPQGVDLTVFPAAVLVEQVPPEARVLVVGGHLVVGTHQFQSPSNANAWMLTIPFATGQFDATSAVAVPLSVPAPADWAIRSMMSLTPFAGELAMVGGVRLFGQLQPGVPECMERDLPMDFCLPKSLSAFALPDAKATDLGTPESVMLPEPRLGAVVLQLDGDTLMVLGGLAGIESKSPNQDVWLKAEPNPWQSTSDWAVSSGFLAVRDGSFDSTVCQDHRPAAK